MSDTGSLQLGPATGAIGAGGSNVRRVHSEIRESALAMDVYAFQSSMSAG